MSLENVLEACGEECEETRVLVLALPLTCCVTCGCSLYSERLALLNLSFSTCFQSLGLFEFSLKFSPLKRKKQNKPKQNPKGGQHYNINSRPLFKTGSEIPT